MRAFWTGLAIVAMAAAAWAGDAGDAEADSRVSGNSRVPVMTNVPVLNRLFRSGPERVPGTRGLESGKGLEFRMVKAVDPDTFTILRWKFPDEARNLDLGTWELVPENDVRKDGKSVSTGRVLYDWLPEREERIRVPVYPEPTELPVSFVSTLEGHPVAADDDGGEEEIEAPLIPFPEEPVAWKEVVRREFVLVSRVVEVDGRAIASAKAEPDLQRGDDAWRLAIEFTPEGAKEFARVTKANAGPGQRLAVVWNGRLLVAPRLETEITGGSAVIAGNFDKETAEEIAEAIKAMNDGADSD